MTTTKAKFDLLPILTHTGETAFEVGLDPAPSHPNQPREHVLPVFRLPTVTSSDFVNRIPRDDNDHEKTLRRKEKEEFEAMKEYLGLSTKEILEMEQMLGVRDSKDGAAVKAEQTNEVRRFMMEQMSLPPLATKRLGVRGRRKKLRPRKGEGDSKALVVYREGEEDLLVVDETPRCLKEKDSKASPRQLKSELQEAIQVMQAYSVAIKEDVLSIKKMCPISNPRAKRFLKQWAAEKMGRILEDLMFSVVLVAWERWKQRVQLEKRLERITAYMKFQSSMRLKRLFENWALRHAAGAWMKWRRLLLHYKKKERAAVELRCVEILQRVFRGHRGRQKAMLIRKQKRALYERKAAVRIQACVRGCMTRRKLVDILRNKAQRDAATKIQAVCRAMIARRYVKGIRVAKARGLVAIRLQALFRGNRDRAAVGRLRASLARHQAAIKIQNLFRVHAAKKTLEKARRYQARVSAATVIQTHIRARLARDRVRWVRKTRAEELARRQRAAIKVQKCYRGHKARVMYLFKIRAHRKKRDGQRQAVLRIQRVARGFISRRRVKKMRADVEEKMMDDARAWVEAWSDDRFMWFYHNPQTGDALWEPPRTGYTKAGGLLVLANGRVVEDPLNKMTEEERADKLMEKKCVECEDRGASRFCKQCGDKYCSSCYIKTHAGGKRAAHVYIQIGPIECSECDKETAVCWCTSCDDPFCGDCWQLIHLRGKRTRHAYCEIDLKGNISSRAIGPDGEDAGTFQAGAGGTGYGSDYSGHEGYDSDYGGAEGVGQELVDLSDWSKYLDDNGFPYWWNAKTGMSQYEDPHTQTQAAPNLLTNGTSTIPNYTSAYAIADNYTGEDYAGGSVGLGMDAVSLWTQYADENNNPYWYNSQTGESTYYPPQDITMAAADTQALVSSSASPWSEALDENGYTYYWNSVTGVSQYERPY